jgi:hypothetical protein
MKLNMLLVLAVILVVASVAVGSAAAKGAGGVTGPAFYVDSELYRTVGTPTDLNGTGAPASSYDTIYEFFGNQPNVATAAPGDKGYNGGRWRVQLLHFPSGYAAAVASADSNGRDIDSDEELRDAFTADTRRAVVRLPGDQAPGLLNALELGDSALAKLDPNPAIPGTCHASSTWETNGGTYTRSNGPSPTT